MQLLTIHAFVVGLNNTWLSFVKIFCYNKQSFTAGLCYAICDGLDWFKEKKAEFHYPVLMTHGEKDGLVSVQDTYDFFREAGSKDKQMKIYGGLFHEILNEYCKDEVIGDMIRWMEVRI